MNQIYKNDYIILYEMDNNYFIESFNSGCTLDSINKILKNFPRIKITNFSNLKKCILSAPQSPAIFAENRSRVEIEISNDHLRAYITIFSTLEELEKYKTEIIKEIIILLKENHIVYGILQNVLLNELKPMVKVLIAEGTQPINGVNSIINMYKLEEPKPKITEDGNVDHYELNLISRVVEREWVGERIDATTGTNGKTILGETITAKPGRNLPLKYDKISIEEEYDEEKGITTLYSKKPGAVCYNNDIICINNCLEIDGDVSFGTGNINFDGFVNVSGIIEDNFLVTAKNDIEIMGNLGLGAINKISSTEGSIYIKGGISGKNKATIYCEKDLFTKFITDCDIVCKGTVHIGFYCINSNIKAKEIILESSNNRIIGGSLNAELKIIANEVGNSSEVPTNLTVTGFDRKQYKKQYDNINKNIDKINEDIIELKQKVKVYAGSSLSKEQKKEFNYLSKKYNNLRKTLKELYEERIKYISYLRTRGDGEISIKKKVHRNSNIKIKEEYVKVTQTINNPITYYYYDNMLNEG